MIGNNFSSKVATESDKRVDHVHNINSVKWRDKATKLQSRRWKKIHELESRNDGGFLKPWAEV